MGFHGNQIGDIVPILLVKKFLLTFQMEQNGTFLDNFKYDYWILHKKLVLDEIFTIFHKINYLLQYWSKNIECPYSGAPFPLGWSHIGQVGV